MEIEENIKLLQEIHTHLLDAFDVMPHPYQEQQLQEAIKLAIFIGQERLKVLYDTQRIPKAST